jgi:hypothetical protein
MATINMSRRRSDLNFKLPQLFFNDKTSYDRCQSVGFSLSIAADWALMSLLKLNSLATTISVGVIYPAESPQDGLERRAGTENFA